MSINNRIRKGLEDELHAKRYGFEKIKNKHDLLLKMEKELSTFDFLQYQKKVKDTLTSNLQDWLAIIPESDEAPKIDALLFEYDTTWWKSRRAYGYGIYNWTGYQLSESTVDVDTPYDIIEKLEHVPSFTLDFYDCFAFLDDDDKIEREYDLEISGYYDLEGFDELTEYAYFKGCIAIHNVLFELMNEGYFKKLNLRDKAMILIGEHDMEERCLLIA